LVELNHFATNKIYPQKVFLLRLSKEELEFRLSQKELDGIELRGSEYLLRIQDAIIQAAKLLDIPLISIDATQSREAIAQEILNNMKEI
jgi:dTMP kinase